MVRTATEFGKFDQRSIQTHILLFQRRQIICRKKKEKKKFAHLAKTNDITPL